jgi:hypothetical protein
MLDPDDFFTSDSEYRRAPDRGSLGPIIFGFAGAPFFMWLMINAFFRSEVKTNFYTTVPGPVMAALYGVMAAGCLSVAIYHLRFRRSRPDLFPRRLSAKEVARWRATHPVEPQQLGDIAPGVMPQGWGGSELPEGWAGPIDPDPARPRIPNQRIVPPVTGGLGVSQPMPEALPPPLWAPQPRHSGRAPTQGQPPPPAAAPGWDTPYETHWPKP